jgi:spermidine/putrescine transport system permease protein
MNRSETEKRFAKLAIPYLIWLMVLVVVPILLMTLLAFMKDTKIDYLQNGQFSFINFIRLTQPSNTKAFINSLIYASITTVFCAVLGYLIAYSLFRSRIKHKLLILTLIILPMWSNLLLKTQVLINILKPNNILTDIFGINEGVNLLGKPVAVIFGLILNYLPFMILPVYTVLEKIDYSLEEASLDLGVHDTKKFIKVIFPLSMKGLVTGSIMVFLPSFSGFVIPQKFSNGNIVFIGNIIEQNFRTDYNFGSLLAILILIIIMGSLFLISKIDKEGETIL